MSLVAWYPLINDLSNNGVGAVTTSGTPTFSSGGKLGNCMTGNDISFTVPSLANSKVWSICFWGYVVSSQITSNWTLLVRVRDNGSHFRFEACPSSYGSGIYCYSTHNNASYAICTGGMTAPTGGFYDQWCHVCVTSDGTTISGYYNGQLRSTWTYTGTGATTGIFDLTNNAKCKKNDLRIYDHCLSAKEVEIISRGLVVHYSLNGGDRGQANLLKSTPKSYNSGSYCAYQFNLTANMVAGQKYTMQLWDVNVAHSGKTSDQLSVYVYWGGGMNSECSWKVPTGHADYLVATFTAQNGGSASDANNLWLNIYNSVPSASGTMSMSIGRWKLESGEVATSYLPATTDTEYTTYGYNVTTEYDTSGNMYDGVRNGTLVQTADTPRYQTCTTFNGTDSFIEADPLPLSTQTISVWLKTTWSSSSGYRMAMHDKNTGLAIGWSGVQLITYVGTGNGGTGSRIDTTNIWTANTWHHVVVVKTGDKTRTVYIDGVECAASGTNYWGGDLVKLNIGARHISGSYAAYFNGLISDFRAYATQLTQAQVLDLYKSCGSISDTGRLLTYELVESY